MGFSGWSWLYWSLSISIVVALKYDQEQLQWNLNTNQDAVHPLDYSGEWEDHVFNPSPSNWRMPFYTVMLDRFVNGNPSNDDANGTQYEHDITQTQLRHGGDIRGLEDSLDYLQGMGIKVRHPFAQQNYYLSMTGPLPCWQPSYQCPLGLGRL